VDIETRRKKQQALIVRAVERKVRSRAREIYESRGQQEGKELQDWFQAESEVLENTAVAPLYRRLVVEKETPNSPTLGTLVEQPIGCN
jgi:hypothetical protein